MSIRAMAAPAIFILALRGTAFAGELAPPKLSFGGQIRARAETTNTQGYATPGLRRGQDQTLLRTRLHLGVDAEEQKLKGFVQLQDSRVWGMEASVAANSANVDLHQGYLDALELFGRPVDLRAGRMELAYGDQRLVSPLDWSNVGRAWDGMRLKWRGGKQWVDAFATNVKEVSHARADSNFWGLYGSCAAVPKYEFDAYLLGRDNADGSYTNERGSKGNLSDRTLGARVKGAAVGFDFTGELARQFGRKAGQPVRAWALAATGGYNFARALKPRTAVEYDFASGDADPGDNRVQTFDPLFPFGHPYQGQQDIFSWKNGHDYKGSVSVDARPGWRLAADYHYFQLARSFDAWYDAATAQLARDATGAAGTNIGSELDLHVKGKFRERIDLWFGYSHFFAGSFVRTTTGRGDRDWAFFSAAWNF